LRSHRRVSKFLIAEVIFGVGTLAEVGGAMRRVGALGVPRGLFEIGVDPADFDRFARNALRDAYAATNPRPVTEDDVRRICLAAY
jgi:alcohol dehydrogenase class IV